MVAVVTRAFRNDRWGVNSAETILTAPAVARQGIRHKFTVAIPGDARGAEAQPLIVPRVTLKNSDVRDLVLIATMANTVIASDAHTGEEVWTCKLGRPVNKSDDIDNWKIQDHWGILSTPVIDLSSMTLYACSWSSPDGSVDKARHYLDAVSLLSGTPVHPPLDLEDAVYDPGHPLPPQRFKSASRKQRASLLQLGQTVFIGFGSIYESAASNRGWVLAIDVRSWRVTAALCTAVKGSGGGIWQAGAGLAADQAGYIYAATGNGDFDGKLDWGETVVKLQYTPPGPAGLLGEIKVVDHWTPFLDSERTAGAAANADEDEPRPARVPTNVRPAAVADASRINAAGHIPLNPGEAADMDLGSGGPVVIDELKIVLIAGKDGILYVIRKDAMGGTTREMLLTPQGVEANYRESLACLPIFLTFYTPDASPYPSNIRDLNKQFYSRTHHNHGSLIVWKSPQGFRLLCWGENSTLRMFAIEALPSPAPNVPNVKINYLAAAEEYASPEARVPPGGMPGGFMALCYDQALPAATPVLFATIPYGDANREITPGRLLAYDLTQFKHGPNGAVIPKIWDSADWGHKFSFNKFCTPTVSNGNLYVPTYDAGTKVYGLA